MRKYKVEVNGLVYEIETNKRRSAIHEGINRFLDSHEYGRDSLKAEEIMLKVTMVRTK